VLTKQALYHSSHISNPFWSGCFGDGGLSNYLLDSASQIGKITDVSYGNLAEIFLYASVISNSVLSLSSNIVFSN
jgi:hypothetical protein